MGKRVYPLRIVQVGEDSYGLMSKGHHDPDEFMRKVRADGWDWPLSVPRHTWLRVVPDPTGEYNGFYHEAKEGTRGAFPATECREAYGQDTYEAIRAAHPSTSQQNGEG